MDSKRKIKITQVHPLFVFVTLPLEISSKQVQEGMNMPYRFPVKKVKNKINTLPSKVVSPSIFFYNLYEKYGLI